MLQNKVLVKEQRANNLHQNARTTFYSQMLMVKRIMEGMSVKEVAEYLGISWRTLLCADGSFAARWSGCPKEQQLPTQAQSSADAGGASGN